MDVVSVRPIPTSIARLTRRPLVAVVALVAFGLVATATAPFTWWARVGCAAGGLVVLVSAVRHRWLRLGERISPIPLDRRSMVALTVWLVLLAGLAGFQIGVFSLHPREDYPTWSHLTNIAFRSRGVRAVGFGAWVAFGVYLVRR
jgi:hypothetical protein